MQVLTSFNQARLWKCCFLCYNSQHAEWTELTLFALRYVYKNKLKKYGLTVIIQIIVFSMRLFAPAWIRRGWSWGWARGAWWPGTRPLPAVAAAALLRSTHHPSRASVFVVRYNWPLYYRRGKWIDMTSLEIFFNKPLTFRPLKEMKIKINLG